MTLFDNVISVVLFNNNKEGQEQIWLKIDCPATGPKPSITVQGTTIKGGLLSQLQLTIGNLAVSQGDIRKVTRMRVHMGYRNSVFETVDCHVLTSYMASPMPNSQVVFIGLPNATGSIGMLEHHQIEVQYLMNKQITRRDVIEGICKGIREAGIAVDLREINKIADIDSEDLEKNGVSISATEIHPDALTALDELNKKLWGWTGGKARLFVNDNVVTLRVFENPYTTKTKTVTDKDGNIREERNDDVLFEPVKLDYVTDAKFSGVLLQVKAPWNPLVRPGKVIEMIENFYTMEGLPNITDAVNFLGGEREEDGNLKRAGTHQYTVLMMNFTFSTDGTSNMEVSAINIDALPPAGRNIAKDVEQAAQEEEKKLQDEDDVNSYVSKLTQQKQIERDIEAAKTNINATFKQTSTQGDIIYIPSKPDPSAGAKAMYMNTNVLSAETVDIYREKHNDIVVILEQKLGGKKVAKKLTVEDVREISKGCKLTLSPGMEIMTSDLWPIVYAATYKHSVETMTMDTCIVGDWKPWALKRQISGTIQVPTSIPDVLGQKSFWKDAMNYFNPRTDRRMFDICGALGYAK